MNNDKNLEIELIKYNMGKEILELLNDKDVSEVIVNDDNKLFKDTFSEGQVFTGKYVDPIKTLSLIQVVASYSKQIIDENNPILEAKLYDNSRFTGVIPPVADNPTINIRKHTILKLTLDDYVKSEVITENQKEIIVENIKNKRNILIVGATGSGKTTFANACINDISKLNERLGILEDTPEIQTTANNRYFLHTSQNKKMIDLVKVSLRMTPSRIIVGEIRDGASLYLLRAWNSGHGGGVCTIHSDSSKKALGQLEGYIQEVSQTPQKQLIADNIHLIIVISKVFEDGETKRKLVEMVEVKGLDNEGNYILKSLN